MGLDQYVYALRPHEAGDDQTGEPTWGVNIFQWRKHPNLHGWMEQLYRAKGGRGEFNGATVRLALSDIDALAQAVETNALPNTQGFFFGKSRPEHREQDELFIALARTAIASDWVLFYDSSW